MSSLVAKAGVPAAARPPRVGGLRRDLGPLTWPTVVAVLSAAAFLVVQPDVGDLQAALARAFAARKGVGLGYWFQWFGGGATPGNYSVLTPTLSGWIGAPLVGALATVAITVLAGVAARGTAHPVAATWVATVVCGLNLWSGRVPFALGTAAALGAYIAFRHRQILLLWALTIVACLSSPVTGAFLAFVLGAAFLVEPAYRRWIWPAVAVAFLTLLGVAIFFGNPGPQPYSIWTALYSGASALFMLLARPAPSVRICLWLTAIAGLAFAIIPTGMGSNWNRMPWIWLPAAAVATAAMPWRRWLIAILPAVIMCSYLTAADVVHSLDPAASASYYQSLIHQLDKRPNLDNYRLEVVQDTSVHTAAYALIGHAALAGGYETQEQSRVNAILQSPKLDATSYKIWLDNNAVGYVAFNKQSADDGNPEYRLLERGGLPYLTEVSSDHRWTLYQVRFPTPIVPKPQTLVSADQAALTIKVPCACSFSIRVRYSNFLGLANKDGKKKKGTVSDDGSGWTVLRTPAPGTYVLSGSVTRPLVR